MFELLISILLMMGIQFKSNDDGRLIIDNGDAALTEVRVDKQFEELGGDPALNAILITDGTDGKE